jgi:excisionase family DNA binding protein
MIPDKKKLVDAMVKAVTKNKIVAKGIKLNTQKRFLMMDTGTVWMDQEIVDTEKDKDNEANLETKEKEMQKVVNVDLTCTTAEAAAMLGVSRSAIYNLIKREEIEAKKIRGKYVIEKNSIYKYAEKKEKRQWLTLLISMSIMLGMIIFWILIISY